MRCGFNKLSMLTESFMLKEMVLTLLGQIDDLEGQLYYLKRQLFGKKSEKLDPAQRMLFEDLYKELQSKLEEDSIPKTPKERCKPNATHKGRRPLPPELDREIIEIIPLAYMRGRTLNNAFIIQNVVKHI